MHDRVRFFGNNIGYTGENRPSLGFFESMGNLADFFTIWTIMTVYIKGYHLRYKTIFCNKVALNVQLMNFFI